MYATFLAARARDGHASTVRAAVCRTLVQQTPFAAVGDLMDLGDESGGEVCAVEHRTVQLARQSEANPWCRQAVLDSEALASADEKLEGDEVDEEGRLEQTEPVPLSADEMAAEAGPQEGDADGVQQVEPKAGKGKGRGKGKGKKGKAGPDPEALASAAEQRLRTATLLFQERFQREQVRVHARRYCSLL